MTPGMWLTAIKDILVLVAVGILGWLLVSFGENRVEKKDLKALEQRIVDNAKTQAQWAQEARDAEKNRQAGMAQVSTAIAAHSGSPVLLCPKPNRSSSVPEHPATSASSVAPARSVDPGSREAVIDIRPSISAFENQYETTLADCRMILQSWPH